MELKHTFTFLTAYTRRYNTPFPGHEKGKVAGLDEVQRQEDAQLHIFLTSELDRR
jgi:hypothetical protein